MIYAQPVMLWPIGHINTENTRSLEVAIEPEIRHSWFKVLLMRAVPVGLDLRVNSRRSNRADRLGDIIRTKSSSVRRQSF